MPAKSPAKRRPRRPRISKSRANPAPRTPGINIPRSLVYCGKALWLVVNDQKIVFPRRKTPSRKPAALLCDARGRALYIVRYHPQDKKARPVDLDNGSLAALTKQWVKWSGDTPDSVVSFANVDTSSVLRKVGNTDEIAYQWTADLADYFHPFDRPATVYANRQKSVFAIKSRDLRITPRGIEG